LHDTGAGDRDEDLALADEVRRLKADRGAVVLAHNYQIGEVQDVADFVGDSLDLARSAAEADADVIVFCGVRFMAEAASILSPQKRVVLPDPLAGCPLADSADEEAVRNRKAELPGAVVVCYVNSSAEVKAESDVCCTSSNAVRVVEAVDADEVLFVPDYNLGHYISRYTDKTIHFWPGRCATHHRVTSEDVERVRRVLPDVPVAVHPECRPSVIDRADFVGSTSQIIRFCRETDARTVVVGTEMGIVHRLQKENPDKSFYLLSPGLVCPDMKFITLEKVRRALETLEPRAEVPEDVRAGARRALDRMLEI